MDAARFGVVSFASSATLRVDISTNATEINAGIDELVAGGGTMISAGFNMARQLFDQQARANATKIALLISDGYGDAGAVAAANLLKADNVTVFAWGFGGANLAQLQLLASDPSFAVLGSDLADLTSYLASLQATLCALPPPSLPPSPPSLPPPSPPCGWFQNADGKWEFSHRCPPPSPPPPKTRPSPPPPPPCACSVCPPDDVYKICADTTSSPNFGCTNPACERCGDDTYGRGQVRAGSMWPLRARLCSVLCYLL